MLYLSAEVNLHIYDSQDLSLRGVKKSQPLDKLIIIAFLRVFKVVIVKLTSSRDSKCNNCIAYTPIAVDKCSKSHSCCPTTFMVSRAQNFVSIYS